MKLHEYAQSKCCSRFIDKHYNPVTDRHVKELRRFPIFPDCELLPAVISFQTSGNR